MSEGLREFDNSRGRCYHCGKLVFDGETWCIPQILLRSAEHGIAHAECDNEYMGRMSQM